MRRAILLGLAAFAVSLGGTTAYLVKTAPAPVAAVATTAGPDSLAARSREADSLVPTDSTAADSAATARPDGGPAPISSAPPVASPGSATPGRAEDPVARALANKQVARVLSAMKPPEAAKVLAFLSDAEVEGILRAVGPRQAADFLTNLPKERAAHLSRRLLVPKPRDATR